MNREHEGEGEIEKIVGRKGEKGEGGKKLNLNCKAFISSFSRNEFWWGSFSSFKLHRDNSGKKESGVEDRGNDGSKQKDREKRGRIWALTWLECFGVVVAIHPRMAIISALVGVGSHGSYWGLLRRCVPKIALYLMPHVHKDKLLSLLNVKHTIAHFKTCMWTYGKRATNRRILVPSYLNIWIVISPM